MIANTKVKWVVVTLVLIGLCWLLLPPKRGTLRYYEKYAANGDANAQYHLAFLHDGHVLGEPDLLTAARWYQAAANQGHPYAAMDIGARYRDGKGVEKDLKKARHYFAIGASNGNWLAQYEMAIFTASGWGGPTNAVETTYWCLRAAKQGASSAKSAIASRYERGTGIEKNLVEAYKW